MINPLVHRKYLMIIYCQLIVCLAIRGQNIQDLSFGTENTLEIMTWNIENFPKKGETTVDYVIDIIEALDVDVLAIQEIEDINSFNQMVNSLDSYDGYLESTFFAGLGFLYKPDIIEIDAIYEIYTSAEYWSFFPRSPMVMEMKYMDERFMIINNHFKCCGDGFLDVDNTNDEETRRYVASNLLKEYVDNNFPDENVIIVGDLNDNLSDESQNNVFQMILDDDRYLFADLEISNGNNSDWSFPNWPSHLDHILITDELFADLENTDSDIQTIKVDDYITGGWLEYEENISDHRPVALKLSLGNSLAVADLDKHKPVFSNFPNPFGLETIFTFNASVAPNEIEIYDLKGQKIVSIMLPEGQSSINFNAEKLSNGIYMAKLRYNNTGMATRKLVVIK